MLTDRLENQNESTFRKITLAIGPQFVSILLITQPSAISPIQRDREWSQCGRDP